jgi:hypothetical protein
VIPPPLLDELLLDELLLDELLDELLLDELLLDELLDELLLDELLLDELLDELLLDEPLGHPEPTQIATLTGPRFSLSGFAAVVLISTADGSPAKPLLLFLILYETFTVLGEVNASALTTPIGTALGPLPDGPTITLAVSADVHWNGSSGKLPVLVA